MIADRPPFLLVFLFSFASLLFCCASSPNTPATIKIALLTGSQAFLQCDFNIQGVGVNVRQKFTICLYHTRLYHLLLLLTFLLNINRSTFSGIEREAEWSRKSLKTSKLSTPKSSHCRIAFKLVPAPQLNIHFSFRMLSPPIQVSLYVNSRSLSSGSYIYIYIYIYI